MDEKQEVRISKHVLKCTEDEWRRIRAYQLINKHSKINDALMVLITKGLDQEGAQNVKN